MKHKFLFTNPELDAQLAQIQQSIRLSMNGVVADSMLEHGLRYKKTFGVTTLRLKEIARDIQPDLALAERLWLLGIRETMILATLLAPAASFPETLAREWSQECDNQELIEQANMNLFQHLSYAVPFSLECIDADQKHLKSFGYTLAIRVSKRFKDHEIEQVVEKGLSTAAENKDNYLNTSIANCLARFCRIDQPTASRIEKAVFESKDRDNIAIQLIRKFVENELIFLGYKEINS